MAASWMSVVLAGSQVADLERARDILLGKGVSDVSVCARQSEVLSLLQQQKGDDLVTVIIAQQGAPAAAETDTVDALELLRTVSPTQARVAAIASGQDDVVFRQLVEHGALDILQAPISEQADRLHFLTAKWQHMLQRKQPAASNFMADFGDSAPDCFSLDMAHISPLDDSLVDLLGPGSATSCGTALDWDQSDELAQSILPGLFGDDAANIGASPFDIMDFGDSGKLLPNEVETSGTSESSVAHLPSFSRQTSLTTCLSVKRKADETSEHSRGASCNTSRSSDLMDDARCKKHKVEWTQELHSIFASVVESIGVDRAVPSQILSGMGASGRGLTRQNIASHLQKYRNRSRSVSLGGMPAPAPMPFAGRAASAPAGLLGEPVPGLPLLPSGCCQLPGMLPGVACWPPGGVAQPGACARWGGWPMGAALPPLPPAPAPPAAPQQPSPALLASLQEALHTPTSKLPLGLRLDIQAVLSSWDSGVSG